MKKLPIMLITASLASATLCNCSQSNAGGIDKANLDTSVAPGTDFYQYATGGWQKANPLPAEFSRFGSFDQLGENNRLQLQELIQNLDTAAEFGSNAQKIADLYALGMDSLTLNAQGAAPILADLAYINALTKDSIAQAMATLPGIASFYDTGVMADLKNAAMNAMYVSQSGLGLGDRDYYIKDGDEEKKILEAYRKYLVTIAELAGYDKEAATRLANNSIDIETQLAKASWSREALRDDDAQYNLMTVGQIEKAMPALGLDAYFKAQGLNAVDTVIVCQPDFMEAANKVIASAPIENVRDFLAAGYLTSAAPYLSDDFVNAEFALDQVISGVEEQQPRWKRAMSVPNNVLGEALGQLYVEKYFPASSKEKMQKLVDNLQVALGQHIDSLTWMSDTTKLRAHEKLNSFTVKIGYPDTWRDYSALTIDPALSYWENIKAAQKFNLAYNLADFGKPVDKARWLMTPQTVNAYYNPTTNEICFPAGILQKPFFDPEADDAVNYGAIGVVIGHEMTHGFDDQGRKYDKDGNMADWWTAQDAEAFEKLANALADQFDQIIVIDSVHANGRLTLGENIADQGGLRVSHTAYLNSLGGAEAPVINGLTPDQRFYLAYANVWAANIRDAEILRRTKTDPHSLGKWRVNATLRNIAPFFEAFEITDGQPMFRPEQERVVIW